MSADPKLIEQIRAHEAAGRPFIAFEYFPPRTAEGVANLYKRLERMVLLSACARAAIAQSRSTSTSPGAPAAPPPT